MDHLGAKLPFKFVDSTYSRGKKPVLGIKDWILRAFILLVQLILIIIDKVLGVAKDKGVAIADSRRSQKKLV